MTNQKNLPKYSLFALGQTVTTPAAIEVFQQSGISTASLLCRHQRGDLRDMDEEDEDENSAALSCEIMFCSEWQRSYCSWRIGWVVLGHSCMNALIRQFVSIGLVTEVPKPKISGNWYPIDR
jgi:hypothetical protein